MRIIAGRFRGAKLQSPEGEDTRPTADRAREALFNLLVHGKFAHLLKGGRIADVFAGTGSIGLEALSRGAAEAVFVEKHKPALAALKANIDKCRARDNCSIVARDATAPGRAASPCDIVFLDAPYRQNLSEPALLALLDNGWLAEGGLVIVQTDPKESFTPPETLTVVDERKYGAARLYFMAAVDQD